MRSKTPRRKAREKRLTEASGNKGADWLRRNRAAIATYNEHVAKHGVYSDGLRSF